MKTTFSLIKVSRLQWAICQGGGEHWLPLTSITGGRRLAMREHHRARLEGEPEYRAMIERQRAEQAA